MNQQLKTELEQEADSAIEDIQDLWDEIDDIIELIYARSQTHPSRSIIRKAIETLDEAIL